MASFLTTLRTLVRAKYDPKHYKVPDLPNDLKHARTERERAYLQHIRSLLDVLGKDPMTGLSHREAFQKADKYPGVYIMIDGDGMKQLNDQYGHQAGHAAILAIAEGIKKSLRPSEVATMKEPSKTTRATRAGGDEFLVHVEGVSLATGIKIARRILDSIHRQSIADHYVGDANTRAKLADVPLRASLGVGYSEDVADAAMYKAKHRGKDRVEFQHSSSKVLPQT